MRGRVLRGALAFALLFSATAFIYIIFVVLDAMPAPEAYANVSDSMDSTVLNGDLVIIRRNRGVRRLERGAIVAHDYPPDPSKRFLKRIVGIPGDTLAMVNRVLHLNGKPVREPYAWVSDTTFEPAPDDFRWQRAYLVGAAARDTLAYNPSRDTWGPIAIPVGMYFVLGDRRDMSLDSRYFGFVPGHMIRGVVRRVYLSKDTTGHVRWNRFGLKPK